MPLSTLRAHVSHTRQWRTGWGRGRGLGEEDYMAIHAVFTHPPRLGLPVLANKNTGFSVDIKLQMNSKKEFFFLYKYVPCNVCDLPILKNYLLFIWFLKFNLIGHLVFCLATLPLIHLWGRGASSPPGSYFQIFNVALWLGETIDSNHWPLPLTLERVPSWSFFCLFFVLSFCLFLSHSRGIWRFPG